MNKKEFLSFVQLKGYITFSQEKLRQQLNDDEAFKSSKNAQHNSVCLTLDNT